MTREQMISTLRGMDFGSTIGSKGDEALRMAIAELEQEPCTDAVSREDRILDLANAIESDESGYWTDKRISSALRNISSVTQKSGKWIPVSERLPEKAFGCFVTVEEDDMYGELHRVIYPDFVGYDETWNDADGEPIPFEVIAWMPLPEPYKGE